jgi:ABC-type phosphonate transport system ATPase subunit
MRRLAVHYGNIMAAAAQFLDELRADERGTADDKNLHKG